ncbi:hypothetical protein ACM6Q7_26245 [Peribacillus butanolivorans]|uniref:hypothetical protein n=1 Tax=Peribacillus butanolivorans TaxID=421767 RepID=UPI0039FBE400
MIDVTETIIEKRGRDVQKQFDTGRVLVSYKKGGYIAESEFQLWLELLKENDEVKEGKVERDD